MPAVSVIIPSYNHAHFLKDAIESVLHQTFQNFEIVVVDDASTDNTSKVIKEFNDPRLHYIVHPKNMGLSATRNTGIKAATGDLIAFLDADDWFHPEKLELHFDYLQQNPDIDVTYNARFELNHSSKTIRTIWRPPASVGLSDFVLGFPYAPSDILIRRERAISAGLLDEVYMFFGEDLYFNSILAMSGCKFANIDRALNYRRYHSGRQFKDIPEIVKVMLSVLDRVFNDPRCPAEVGLLKPAAYAHYYSSYGILALVQQETSLGQYYLEEAIQLKPSLLEGDPHPILQKILDYSIRDDSLDHEQLLDSLLKRLPGKLNYLSDSYLWAASCGYLLKGVRAIMWDRDEDGSIYFSKAAALHAEIEKSFLQRLSADILSYEMEFGSEATQVVLNKLSPFLEMIGSKADVKWLKGCVALNRGFRDYKNKEYNRVPPLILEAIVSDPSYFFNRGVIKIFLNSLAKHAF